MMQHVSIYYGFLFAIIPLNKAKPPHNTAQVQPQIEKIREIIMPAMPKINVRAPMIMVIKSRCFIKKTLTLC